jgi:hypothetical protein
VAGGFEGCTGWLSLRGFMRVVGQPSGRLRDHLRSASGRLTRQEALDVDRQQGKAMAFSHPTDGSRPVPQVRKGQGEQSGRERVRAPRKAVGLQPRRPSKTRRPAPKGTESADFPQGRRVQRDATRWSLDDGVAWRIASPPMASVGARRAGSGCAAASIKGVGWASWRSVHMGLHLVTSVGLDCVHKEGLILHLCFVGIPVVRPAVVLSHLALWWGWVWVCVPVGLVLGLGCYPFLDAMSASPAAPPGQKERGGRVVGPARARARGGVEGSVKKRSGPIFCP